MKREDALPLPARHVTGARKIGFLGAGYILHAHALAVAALRATAGLELHAVADLSAARARDAASRFGIAHACTDAQQLIDAGCTAVHVLLPPDGHEAAARRLIEAGVDVLLEKPMAPSAAECRDLVAIASARRVRLGVSHNFLFLRAHERLRSALCAGELGQIDHVGIEWRDDLPLLRHGPFEQWMLREPGHLLLEIGPHLAAFVLDVLDLVDGAKRDAQVRTADAAHPLALPGGRTAWRRWTVSGESGGAGFTLGLSLGPGEPLRRLTVRGLAGVATLDYRRDSLRIERTADNNAALDALRIGLRGAREEAAQTLANARRAIGGTLAGSPQQDSYRDSIYRCVRAFHGAGEAPLDARLDAAFGERVMRLCESAVQRSGVAARASVASTAAAAPAPAPAAGAPEVLVVGGTGFIGRRLVRALLARGRAVRVLTRSAAAARAAFDGLPVEIVQGHHGDAQVLSAALQGIGTVYHLAKADGQRWDDYVQHDVEPTRVLAECALAAGVRRFVYTGTIDSHASAEAATTIDGNTALDARIDERNLYARSKAACEALLMRLHSERALPLVVLRPGIVIGEGTSPAHWGVGLFRTAAAVELWGAGRHPLPFVLVDDVAQALLLAGEREGIEGEVFLVTDEPLLSARDYVAAMGERERTHVHTAATPIWRHYLRDLARQTVKQLIGHPNRRRASLHDWACRAHTARYDNRKTRERLGWQPASSRERLIAEGVHAAVDGYLR